MLFAALVVQTAMIFLFDLILEPEPEEPKEFSECVKVEEVEEVKEEEEEIEISEEQTIPANLERLWSFTCDLTKGLNVSSLAWNKLNPVSYQTFSSIYWQLSNFNNKACFSVRYRAEIETDHSP